MRSHCHGFSLIEMMVALTVLGVGIVAVMHGLSGAMEGNRRVEDRTDALDLLRLKAAEYSTVSRETETQSGRFDPPFEDYQWTAQIKPTDFPDLFRLEVEVSWPGRHIRRHIRSQTLVPQQ